LKSEAEEIPAGYIIPALNAFQDPTLSALDRARIDHGKAQIFGNARVVLLLMIDDVAPMQTQNNVHHDRSS
jgi:glycyl-tRNA synthetase beta chain